MQAYQMLHIFGPYPPPSLHPRFNSRVNNLPLLTNVTGFLSLLLLLFELFWLFSLCVCVRACVCVCSAMVAYIALCLATFGIVVSALLLQQRLVVRGRVLSGRATD